MEMSRKEKTNQILAHFCNNLKKANSCQLISWNVNGLRSIFRKGFLNWLKKSNPDILCLQEVKLQEEQLPIELSSINSFVMQRYSYYSNYATKPGYSGVIILTKVKPLMVQGKLGMERFDQEGRMLHLEFPYFHLINLYLPHGGRKKENLAYKLNAYHNLLRYINNIKSKNIILIGDFNIAHTELDLARPKNNQSNVMFTPEERKEIDSLMQLGFFDSFRKFHPMKKSYTWWPYMANARKRNLGWRIDYAFISNTLNQKIKDAFILHRVYGSDHCPVGFEINI